VDLFPGHNRNCCPNAELEFDPSDNSAIPRHLWYWKRDLPCGAGSSTRRRSQSDRRPVSRRLLRTIPASLPPTLNKCCVTGSLAAAAGHGTTAKMAAATVGMVTPFRLNSSAQFRDLALSQGPFVYPTAAYWKQAFDVLELSAQLGDTEKVIADTGRTAPARSLLQDTGACFAQEISRRDQHNLDQDVKLFFHLRQCADGR